MSVKMTFTPPVAAPRKSLLKKSAPVKKENLKISKREEVLGYNPFLTLRLPRKEPQACQVILECGHKCTGVCKKSAEEHSVKDCIITSTCSQRCPRGHECYVSHKCAEQCQPCVIEIKINYECGHSISVRCCQELSFRKCRFVCGKKLDCGHLCSKACSEKCGPCTEIVSGTFPNCHHKYFVSCSNRGKTVGPCPNKVKASIIPECGHQVSVQCQDRTKYTFDQLSDMCDEPCANGYYDYGGCGHPCDGICSSCSNGVFHERCNDPCGRNLICGHVCLFPCSRNCPPCTRKCLSSCDHGVCSALCGIPCSPCEEPCTWICPHQKCTNTCDEICNRELCNLPCPEILDCGHPCVSFCGEPCPKLCRYCDSSKLLEWMLDGRTAIEDDDRFIKLTDCNHTFEVESLDHWMAAENEDGEITMKTCPLCRTIIWTCHRYSAILNQQRQRLSDIKCRVFGSLDDIKDTQIKTIGSLLDTNNIQGGMFKQFRSWLVRHLTLENDIDENGEPNFLAMNLRMVKCLEYVTDRLNISERIFNRLSREYGPDEFNVIEHYYREAWHFIKTRKIPLTMTEMADLDRQFSRAEDMIQLMDRRLNERGPGFLDILRIPEAIELYDDAYSVLAARAPFTPARREEFLRCLAKLDKVLHCELGITEYERRMIVSAFGTSVGRWFKCANGHIYVVTECGGPTEVGVCNECGNSVGGTNHATVGGNRLAFEMDGATAPLYPTALLGLPFNEVAAYMVDDDDFFPELNI